MPINTQKVSECYEFDASTRTVTIKDLDFQSWVSITHVDSGKVIYNVDLDERDGVQYNHTLSLTFNTANMTNYEPLRIVYEARGIKSSGVSDDIHTKILHELQDINKLLRKIYY